MREKPLLLLFSLLILSSGCAILGPKPAVPEDACRLEASPDGAKVLLTRDGRTLYSKDGSAMTLYADGRAFFSAACTGTNETVAAFMVHIRDSGGGTAYTLVDENADGLFERKIDFGTKAVYLWKDNRWANAKP